MDFLRTSFRYLTRDRAFSYINVLGLAVGLTALFCITLYLLREMNYDRFHKNADRIYRVSISTSGDGIEDDNCQFTSPIGPEVKAAVPEVEQYARFSLLKRFVAAYNDKLLMLNAVCFADTSFFDMFTFPLLLGNPETALTAPFSIVLTEDAANKLFGDTNPTGKTILLDIYDYTVTGVVKSPPSNSYIYFDALTSFSTLYRLPDVALGWNGGNQYITFFRLHKNTDIKTVTAKMNEIIWENLGKEYAEGGWNLKGYLQPLLDIHLYHDNMSEELRVGLIIFFALGLIILFIAVINFVNLTTARSMKRVRESGMRKVMGAGRFGLVKQFLGESLMISMMAFAAAMFLFLLIRDFYLQTAGGALPDTDLILKSVFAVLIIALFAGIIGGIYPAVRLSSLNLLYTTKGGETAKGGKNILKNILIIIQFASSVILIVGTIVTSRQLTYLKNKDLGFKKENILILPLNGDKATDRANVLKERLLNNSEIMSVTATSQLPGFGFTSNGYKIEGIEHTVMVNVVDVDEDFLNVFDIKLKEGRFFSGSEHEKSFYVVNETFVKTFGWDDNATGKTITRDGLYEVIGVVNDFNFYPLYSNITPLIITNDPWRGQFRYLSIKFIATDLTALISKTEKIWKEVNPDVTFEYSFYDVSYNNIYEMEILLRNLFAIFAGIAILLAVTGIFGLMAYTTQRRRKEIGIRKVMGASVGNILMMMLKQTGIQIVIANIIALPLAFLLVQWYLDNYAYRIAISPIIFVSALAVSSLVALLAVGTQVLRAAMENPAKAIE